MKIINHELLIMNIIFIAFGILIGMTIANSNRLKAIQKISRDDWILDSIGLWLQGVLIPFLQMGVVYQIYAYLLPMDKGSLSLHPLLAFLVSFVGIDYFYYWNHRLLHNQWFWSLHQVHHTMTERLVLGTSRNTIWASFLIIYLWIHPLFIYLLQDPSLYIVGISLTSALDLWRHSEIEPQPGSFIYWLLSPWLILPLDHAWHHATIVNKVNYGANLKLWDWLHGTYYKSQEPPDSLGIKTDLNLIQKLIFPFK